MFTISLINDDRDISLVFEGQVLIHGEILILHCVLPTGS